MTETKRIIEIFEYLFQFVFEIIVKSMKKFELTSSFKKLSLAIICMCLSARNQIIYWAIFYHLDFANYSFKWKFKVTTSVFVKQKASKQYAKAVSVVYFKILKTIIRACTGAALGAERVFGEIPLH